MTARSCGSQYQNTAEPVRSGGGELELRRDWRGGFMASLNYALQRSSYEQDASLAGDRRLREVPNSPVHTGGARLTVPLAGRALRASSRLAVESARYDVSDHPGDPPQQKLDAGVIWDLVLSGDAPDSHASWSAGFDNAADWRQRVPVSVEFQPIRAVNVPGRTLVAQVTVTW